MEGVKSTKPSWRQVGRNAAACEAACRDMLRLTVGEERLREFPEEGFEEAADDVEVLPLL